MEYYIKTISERQELESCPLFCVDQFNWGGKYRPQTCGKFAYLKDEGFLLRMTCKESDPVCRYREDFEPVWMDSAMEGFFAFDKDSDYYMNFEINSAGAMVASYGCGKTGRKNLTCEETAAVGRQVLCLNDSWSVELFIPLGLVQKYYGSLNFSSGNCIRMNFFKLAEGQESNHFASYAPIICDEPNFHLPQFFARGIFS